ncbi:peptidase S8, partial [Diaphorobacter sp. DS2]
MKKKRIIGSAVLSVAMGLSVFASGAFGQQVESNETYRVVIQGPTAEKA